MTLLTEFFRKLLVLCPRIKITNFWTPPVSRGLHRCAWENQIVGSPNVGIRTWIMWSKEPDSLCFQRLKNFDRVPSRKKRDLKSFNFLPGGFSRRASMQASTQGDFVNLLAGHHTRIEKEMSPRKAEVSCIRYLESLSVSAANGDPAPFAQIENSSFVPNNRIGHCTAWAPELRRPGRTAALRA